MRKEFLRSVAGHFLSLSGGELRGYTFVFPNRRSSLFFRRYIGECAGRPVFSPCLTNINDMFSRLSGLRLLDKVTLMHRLYTVFCDSVDGFSESFDDFIYRAEVVLNDFDDIDKYLVDARGLFTNISDLKEIDNLYDYLSDKQREAVASFWGVVIPYRDKNKERQFLDMWRGMYDIYTSFRSLLLSRGEAYEGMIYRSVAGRLRDEEPDLLKELERYGNVVFVGLNAPNQCERQLFNTLQKSGRGDFYWDYYGDAIKDKANKSSLFMEDNVRRYPSRHPLPEDGGLCGTLPEITAVSVPSAAGQTKYVHEILRRIAAESGTTDLFSTAVLLPDEQLLFPLLNSLPEEITPVNVTMGYPLDHSNVSSFVRSIASLQERLRVRDGQVCFYFKDVLNVLAHPYISGALCGRAEELRRTLVDENRIYPPASMLDGGGTEPLLALIFKDARMSGVSVSESVSDYLQAILDAVSAGADRIDREFLMGYSRSLNLLRSLNMDVRKDTYFRLLRRVESSVSIPFSGEPLDGLQIMGPLEIRALDFENLIILSVNEGTFPSRNTASSMIPYNLRRGFGLPTYEFQDSISAYHFYRSICRAKKVWLISDSRSEGLKSGEESRYVKQLEYHFHYPVRRLTVTFGITGGQLREVAPVAKTQEDMERLSRMTFSNSSLQMWMSCPMRFYYQYVLGLKEEKDISEGVDNAAFGTLYHYVMKELYQPYLGRVVDKDTLLRMADDADGHIAALVERGFYDKNGLNVKEITGRNKIAGALVRNLAARTLRNDAALAPLTVRRLERTETVSFRTQDGRGVRLTGIFDRVDMTGGSLRIIDYKTGGEHFTCTGEDMDRLFDAETCRQGSHIFQLMLYLLIMDSLDEKIFDNVGNVLLEIYYTKNLHSGVRSCRTVTGEQYERFRERLSGLIGEILSPDVPFTACEDGKACAYCPFTAKCNR
ncbi:MAG TPA: PD-(D/E)XK nuclease family protein [Candidatus Coprenecus stercoravium]|uniref:PD-(D/E)XK nuclease family protein n=1 Tax=Candidatus Coprenecus stercoravium TaxID=2840735 RepID=A0A9D2KB10_9BACT|nr:PD-(D/E)XK nuclease family protein [Candidatus Coprenecus stercoravium]